MKCPWCGYDMKKGYLQSGHRVAFTEKPHILLWDDTDIPIIKLRLGVLACDAWCCTVCQKVVVDYGENRTKEEETTE